MQIDLKRKRARAKRLFRAQRERLRGYRLNPKWFGIAIGVEIAIIASGLYAGYLFAVKYSGADAPMPTDVAALTWLPFIHGLNLNIDFGMALVGAGMLAAAELCRLPLAMAFRSHRHWGMRILALFAVLGMVVVTTKTVGTVLGQAYHIRRIAVIEATDTVKTAEADLATVAAKKGSAATALAPLQARVDAANKRLTELNDLIKVQGQAPKTVCSKVPHRDKRSGKRWTTTSCSTPKWAGQQFADQLDAAVAERDAAAVARDASAGAVGNEVERVAAQEKVVAEAKARQRETIMRSQLHDFAGIVLGKDAVDLTEAELNWFMRLFVLVPALLVAAASTVLAMVAFTRLRPAREIQHIIVQLPAALRGPQEA